jgi:hypothetical protein
MKLLALAAVVPLLGCDPIMTVRATVKTAGQNAAPIEGAKVRMRCGSYQSPELGMTDASGQVAWADLGWLNPECELTAEASGRRSQSVRIADAQGGVPHTHFVAAQFDLASDGSMDEVESSKTPPSPPRRTVAVHFVSKKPGVEVRTVERRFGHLSSQPVLCLTPCTALLPEGSPELVFSRGEGTAKPASPMTFTEPTTVTFDYADHKSWRTARIIFGVASALGFSVALVGIAAKNTPVTISAGAVFGTGLLGIAMPKEDAVTIDNR